MSDVSQGPGWWIASDQKWYPPEQHPNYVPPPPPPPPPPAATPTPPPGTPPPPGAVDPTAAIPPVGQNPTTAMPPVSPTDIGEPTAAYMAYAAAGPNDGEPDPASKPTPLYKKWWFWVIIGVVLLIIIIVATNSSKKNSDATATTAAPAPVTTGAPATPATAPPTTAPPVTTAPAPAGRQVQGALVTLGAGTFTGGKDVAVGLYDVTAGAGQSGNFIVNGPDTYDEILGTAGGAGGVPMVRVKISTGDQIQISGLSAVTFTPVTTPLVTSHTTVNLYAGTWVVGQDIGAGRYVATPGAGQSGNFIVSGNDQYNEILGGDSSVGGVPSVTVTLTKGDVIDISGLGQVTMTAQ